MWRLRARDFLRGAFIAILTGMGMAVLGLVGPQFDLFTVDWASLGHTAVNAGVVAFVSYLTKNLVTDSDGRIFGRL